MLVSTHRRYARALLLPVSVAPHTQTHKAQLATLGHTIRARDTRDIFMYSDNVVSLVWDARPRTHEQCSYSALQTEIYCSINARRRRRRYDSTHTHTHQTFAHFNEHEANKHKKTYKHTRTQDKHIRTRNAFGIAPLLVQHTSPECDIISSVCVCVCTRMVAHLWLQMHLNRSDASA